MIIESVGVDGGRLCGQIDNAHVVSREYGTVFIGDVVKMIVYMIAPAPGTVLHIENAAVELEVFVVGADVDRIEVFAVHQHEARDILEVCGDGKLGHRLMVGKVAIILFIVVDVAEDVVVVQIPDGLAVDLVGDGHLLVMTGVVGDADLLIALISLVIIAGPDLILPIAVGVSRESGSRGHRQDRSRRQQHDNR